MKVIYAADQNPANSIRRVRDAAVIPPYTFVGKLKVGTSPMWSPHSTYDLTRAYFSAATTGTSEAGIAIMKVEGGANYYNSDVAQHIVLGAVQVHSNVQKKSFPIAGTISPYDSMYLLSFNASGHRDVVLQILGELV